MQDGTNAAKVEDDESETGRLQFIVKKTNEVLGTNHSLVSFDSKKGRDLLQVLNDIFANLSPSMAADVTREDPGTTFRRLADFLGGILNYKPPPDRGNELQSALTMGEPQYLYPIFQWVLRRMPENRKRVYLAQYLTPLPVPEDMVASDDGVREVHQQYRSLVEQFKEIHRVVDKLKADGKAEGTKSLLTQLEQEKEQLTHRVQATQRKLHNLPGGETLFKGCQQLRVEAEADRLLEDRYNEQLGLHRTAEQRIQQATTQLADIKRDFADLNLDKMMKALQDEIAMSRVLAHEKLPKQLADYRSRVDATQKALSEPLDADALGRQVAQLEREIKEIEDRAKPKVVTQDESTLGLFRQQAALVSGRKDQVLREVRSLREAKARLEEDLAAKEQELRGVQGSRILKGEEFKAYANSLRGKSTTYKRLKAELQELKAEVGILQRTEEILQQRHQVVNSSVVELEKQKGIAGYRDLKDNLVAISETKMEIDEAKGQTLEELSKVVQDFLNNIRDRRSKLAPQILELRNIRQRCQTIEQEHQQKKEVYDALQQELEDDIVKVKNEFDAHDGDCRMNESLFHRINCQVLIAEVQHKRAQDERDFRAGTRKLSEQYKTWADMLEREGAALEALSRDLRERKKDIEETHEANAQQMRWFGDLKKLLECKVAVHKKEASGSGPPALPGVDMALVSGVDRLVL